MIYPGAVWRPGRNAGYASGRSLMTTAVCHYTVGRDSAPIGDRGYFNFLVRRDGEIVQFAEADAITWHAGNWNTRGPGIEVEYLDEDTIFTPEAYAATAGLVEWLIGLGIPDAFYDGPRTNSHAGFITHRSLIQTGDAHSDYWPELPRVAPPKKRGRMNPGLFVDANGAVWVYDPNTKQKAWVTGPDELSAIQAIRALDGLPVDIVRNETTDVLLAGAIEIKKRDSGGALDLSGFTISGTFTGAATPGG